MRKVFRASLLLIALSCPTFAGIIHNPPPEPSPAPTSSVQEPIDGTLPNSIETEYVAVEVTLNLLQVILPLF
jgi:hypothetical protein